MVKRAGGAAWDRFLQIGNEVGITLRTNMRMKRTRIYGVEEVG